MTGPLKKTTFVEDDDILIKMSDNHIRVAVVGNVDAGKSTLIGTLTSNTLDNGRGLGRTHVLKHPHEKETGRTSDITTHLMGFDEQGDIVVAPNGNNTKHVDSYIAKKSTKLVTLMDLAGHEKYLKTTVEGISRGMVDYAIVVVNSMQPPTHMTKHHLNLCVTFGIPVIVVMTKIDRCTCTDDHTITYKIKETKAEIAHMLRSTEIGNLRLYQIHNETDVGFIKDKIGGSSSKQVPLVALSCVTGVGLNLLHKLLLELPQRWKHKSKISKPFEMFIEDVFTVSGVGMVISGFVNRGEWYKGEAIYIGPLKNGNTNLKVVPKSCHVAQTDVNHVWAGHSVCFAIPSMKAKDRRLFRKKGMVALKEPIKTVTTFHAEIYLLNGVNVTVTKDSYVSMLHILHMKEPARVIDIFQAGGNNSDENVTTLRPGQGAKVTFELTRRPAYIHEGMKLIMRDGHVRGIGRVISVGTPASGNS